MGEKTYSVSASRRRCKFRLWTCPHSFLSSRRPPTRLTGSLEEPESRIGRLRMFGPFDNLPRRKRLLGWQENTRLADLKGNCISTTHKAVKLNAHKQFSSVRLVFVFLQSDTPSGATKVNLSCQYFQRCTIYIWRPQREGQTYVLLVSIRSQNRASIGR